MKALREVKSEDKNGFQLSDVRKGDIVRLSSSGKPAAAVISSIDEELKVVWFRKYEEDGSLDIIDTGWVEPFEIDAIYRPEEVETETKEWFRRTWDYREAKKVDVARIDRGFAATEFEYVARTDRGRAFMAMTFGRGAVGVTIPKSKALGFDLYAESQSIEVR
jgi:hypothetical protein